MTNEKMGAFLRRLSDDVGEVKVELQAAGIYAATGYDMDRGEAIVSGESLWAALEALAAKMEGE